MDTATLKWTRGWRVDVVLTIAGQPGTTIGYRDLDRPTILPDGTAPAIDAASSDLMTAVDSVVALWKSTDAPALAKIASAQQAAQDKAKAETAAAAQAAQDAADQSARDAQAKADQAATDAAAQAAQDAAAPMTPLPPMPSPVDTQPAGGAVDTKPAAAPPVTVTAAGITVTMEQLVALNRQALAQVGAP